LNSWIDEFGNELALEILPVHHLESAPDTWACPANLEEELFGTNVQGLQAGSLEILRKI
jgi:hypothetical protein